jgi:hypothetical protein
MPFSSVASVLLLFAYGLFSVSMYRMAHVPPRESKLSGVLALIVTLVLLAMSAVPALKAPLLGGAFLVGLVALAGMMLGARQRRYPA